eukprot:scaffold741_cov336-Pavlova_lutheri.AAC.60
MNFTYILGGGNQGAQPRDVSPRPYRGKWPSAFVLDRWIESFVLGARAFAIEPKPFLRENQDCERIASKEEHTAIFCNIGYLSEPSKTTTFIPPARKRKTHEVAILTRHA